MKKAHTLILAGMALSLGSCDQLTLVNLYMANEFTEAEIEGDLPHTIGYKDLDGWILLEGRVNNHAPVNFVLDTGASVLALIDAPNSAHLKLDMRGSRRIGSADDLAAPVGATQTGLRIDFGGLVLDDQTALALPASSLDCTGKGDFTPPFEGVIGHDLFRRFTVEVNRDNHTVTFHDPETYVYRGSGKVVPAEISGRQPFVTTKVSFQNGKAVPLRLHVDSGAGIDLSLFPSSSPEIAMPNKGTVKDACFVGGKAQYRIGQPVELDFGGLKTRSPVDYPLGREVVDSDQNGRIGARFLEQFNVVFDYERERIILEPRNRTSRSANSFIIGAVATNRSKTLNGS